MIPFDDAHRAVHYPNDRRFRVWVRPSLLVGLLVLALMPVGLAWVQNAAIQLRDAPQPPAASGESLLVIIDRSARESGLGNALAGSEPLAGGSLSIRLEKAPFDALMGWLARLSQQNGVLVDSAIIEKAGAPGLVNAAIVLHSG